MTNELCELFGALAAVTECLDHTPEASCSAGLCYDMHWKGQEVKSEQRAQQREGYFERPMGLCLQQRGIPAFMCLRGVRQP